MKQAPGVHTMPAPDGATAGWWNKVDGEWVSKHRYREAAVAAGREIARVLRKDHVIHGADGGITEKNSHGKDAYPPTG